MSERTNQTFKLKTLRDVYELPTAEMMERALRELTSAMIAARRTEELVGAVARDIAKKDGVEIPEARDVIWPEECDWTDDAGVPSEMRFVMPDTEQELMRVEIK